MSDDERNKTGKPVNLDEMLKQAKQPLPDFGNPDSVQDDSDYDDSNMTNNRIILPKYIPVPSVPSDIGQSSYLILTPESLSNFGTFSTPMLAKITNHLCELYNSGTYELVHSEIILECAKLAYAIQATGVDTPPRIALNIARINLPPERLLCSAQNPTIILSSEAYNRFMKYASMPPDSLLGFGKFATLEFEGNQLLDLLNSGPYDIVDVEIVFELAKVVHATKASGKEVPLLISYDVGIVTLPPEFLSHSPLNPTIILSNEACDQFIEYLNMQMAVEKADDNKDERNHDNPTFTSCQLASEMIAEEEWERTLAYYGDYINEQTHGYNDTTSAGSGVRSTAKEIICYAGVRPKPVEWLWDNRIPLGKLTLLQGEPGVGKSYLALKLAAEVTKGGTLPGKDKEDGDQPVPQGNVIYQSAEDDITDTIIPRFLKMSGKRAYLFCIDETEKALTLNDERIKRALETYKPKLMILDPLAAYLGYDVDINRSNQVRPLFAKLAKWAEEYSCAIVMITHLSKSKFTKGSVYASLGSIDMAAACRCILGVRYIYNTDERLVYQVKNNVGMKPKPVKFALDLKHGINWRGVFESSKKNEDGSAKVKPKSKLDEAKEATLEMIKKRINTSKAMKREYESKDIKAWAYNKARKELQEEGCIRMSKMKGRYDPKAEAKWEIVEPKADTNG